MKARHRVVQKIDALKPVRVRHHASLGPVSVAIRLAWEDIDVRVIEFHPGDPRLDSHRHLVRGDEPAQACFVARIFRMQ